MLIHIAFHLADRRLVCRFARMGGEGGMFVGVSFIDALYDALHRSGMSGSIVGKLMECPIQAVVELDPITVHEIDATRYVVVVVAVGIGDPVRLHQLPHPFA